MGREKSAIHSRDKALHKTSVHSQAISRPTKKPNQNKKELEEMDSLMFLKDSKDKKESNGLDEKIKLLKSELKMLLGDSKLENSHDKSVSSYENVLVSQDLLVDKYDQKKPLVLKSEIEGVEKFSSKTEQPDKLPPTKFSEWLDKTIDEMTVKSQNQKEFYQHNDLLLNPKPQKASTLERFSPAESSSKLEFNLPLQSQFKVEQLLYKSFYLQHFEIYLSSSDENDSEEIKSTKVLKQQKRKSRKSLKSNKEKFYQSNLKKCHRSSHKVRKKRTAAKGSSKSSRDLVYNSASDSNNVVEEKNVDYVELDVSDYDWSEPFEIDEKTGIFSDIEILENPEEKRTDTSEEIKSNNFGPMECDLNATNDESDKDNLRMVWECPICFECSKGQEVVATQCGHVFCKKCLESHLSEFSKNCPTCRTDLSNKPSITLFNF